ncbi:MAG TPA: glycosyltransferase family 2 protein, partial [Candidatus Paceibacterota bacterium]|nr:glycosyltransferase family 2 protein [Candidatus Paceibacterota bacterium]
IIPAYNEAQVIGRVLKELGRPVGCAEIIVVNDGSTDKTAEIASENGARVISHQYNKGYGSSLKTGILSVKTEIAIMYDADGQHRPEDLEKIAQIADKYDMVIGVRDKNSQKDWFRVPGKIILNIFAKILSGHKIPDLNSGLRSFKVSVIKQYLHLMPNGFSMSTTSTIAFLKMGHTINYIPIQTRFREGRRSSVEIKDGLKVLMLVLNLIVLFNPQRVFLPMSLFFFLLGIGYFIYYSLTVYVDVTSSMLLLIVVGVIIFFMGIICEHVSAIRRELHK